MLKYVSEFRGMGIEKTSYSPFLRNLLLNLKNIPLSGKRKHIISECRAFMKRRGADLDS